MSSKEIQKAIFIIIAGSIVGTGLFHEVLNFNEFFVTLLSTVGTGFALYKLVPNMFKENV